VAEPTLVRDFSCKGCILQLPAPASDAAPLLLALHGDSHDAAEMLGAWKDVARAQGAVLFAPTCPKELKCPGGSWWRWLQSSAHDATWLGRQLDAVRAHIAIDAQRIYATGYSGGSSYLGYWAPAHSAELAAVGYVSGGYPFATSCAHCKIPVRAVIGAADGMLEPYVKPLLGFFEACGGHEISTRVVPALGHKGMLAALPAGEAERLWSWFSTHTAQCVVEPDAGSPGPAPSAVPAARVVDAGAPVQAGETAHEPAAARGCACDHAAGTTGAPTWPWALLAITCVRALRPRTRRPRAHRAERRCPERWYRRGSTRREG